MAGKSRADAEALLSAADRIYGVHAGKIGVEKALDHIENESSFHLWVLHHLHSDSLLTPDELAIYTALDRDGSVDALSSAQDLTQVQSVSEHEIKRAIDELQASTNAIKKQTEILQLQSQALDRSIQKRTGNYRRRRDLEIVQQRKLENDHKHLSGEVESLSYGIEQQLQDMSQDGDASLPRMQAIVADTLRSDDKLLASLQKLGNELDREDPHEKEHIEKMREICLRLIKTTVETIRTRLDRVYLETLCAAAYQHHASPPSSAEIKDLGDELESLYAEILPVAQMSIEQHRLEPAVKGISAREGDSIQRSAIAIRYISDCLGHLLEKTRHLMDQIETTSKHHKSSSYLLSSAKKELSASTAPPFQLAQPTVPASPVRRPSPIRMPVSAVSSSSRRRSSGILEIPAIENLLESLGIQAPDEETPANTQFDRLNQVLQERNKKRDDIIKNAQDSYEAITTSHLDDLHTAVQLLSDSALAEMTNGEVRFVDADFEASIQLLKVEVEQAQESLSRLEMKHTGKKSEKKEDLLHRWTS